MMQPFNATSPKKPSPLSFGAQRSSPFKRPESPSVNSATASRPSTPTSRPPTLPSQIPNLVLPDAPPSPASSVASTVVPEKREAPSRTDSPVVFRTPAASNPSQYAGPGPVYVNNAQATSPATGRSPARPGMQRTLTGGDPISKLHPAQLRDMRESFQVMDRDNDGQVDREDIAEVLLQLGLDASAPSLTPYFPPSAAPKLNLPTYLNTLSGMLADLSRHDELAAAFAAFDVDDSGQIDVDELRDALLHTNPGPGGRALSARELDNVFDEFSSRRTLGKGNTGRRGEVFRYMDFMSQIEGANKAGQNEQGLPDSVKA